MKKLMILTAIMLFVAATSVFVFAASPQHQYDKNSSFILGSVTFGSAALASNAEGTFTLKAGEKTSLDTSKSFTTGSGGNFSFVTVTDSTAQSTSGFVSFTGCINNCGE